MIRIYWHDACSFDRIRSLAPEVYVTALPRTGYFYDVLKDPESEMFYLVMSKEMSIGEPPEGDSIPVPLVTTVEVLVPAKSDAPAKRVRKALKVRVGEQLKVIEHVVKVGV